MEHILIDVESRPGHRRSSRLVMTEDEIAIGECRFRWAEVDRVRYDATERQMNGGYLGTTFTLGVGDARTKAVFTLESGTIGALKTKIDHERREQHRELWTGAVGILEQRVCGPLVARAVAAVREQGSVELAGLRIDRQGVRRNALFARPVPWSEFAGAGTAGPFVAVFARRGDKPQPRITVSQQEWNAALLRRVLSQVSEPAT